MSFRAERFSDISSSSSAEDRLDGAAITPLQFGAFLLLAFAILFPKVIAGSDTFFYRDFGVIAYPVIFQHHESFWRGELPLWNPLSNCGAPFLAQWGTMVLYPANLFYLLLPLPWSLNVFCLLHLVLGGMGAYYLARRWTHSEFAAAVAGTFFIFNGVTFSCLIWPNYAVALGWMPWVVFTAEAAWVEGGRRIVIAAIVAALQLLAGVPEIVALTWGLIVLLFLVQRIGRSTAFFRSAARLGMVCVLAAGLIAIQLLPFFDLLANSQRSSGISSAKWPLPIWALGNFLVPLFHCFPTAQGVYFQPGQEFFTSTYLGIASVVLGTAALWWRRTKCALLLAATTIASVWLALGEPGLLLGVMQQLLPGVNVARYPVKFLLLATLTVPLLAAFAVAELQSRSPAWPRRHWNSLIAIAAVVLAGIGVILWFARRNPFPLDHWAATWQSGAERAIILVVAVALLRFSFSSTISAKQTIGGWALLLLAVADLVTHVPSQNPTLPSHALAPNLWQSAHSIKPPVSGEGRVMISPEAEDHLLMSRVPDPYKDFIGKRLASWSNLNLLDGIPKVNGSSTLQLREQMEVQSLLYKQTNRIRTNLINFLGVSMTTAPGSIVEWTNRSGSLPLVTIGQQPVFANASNTIAALNNDALDPREIVYLPVEAESTVKAERDPTATAVIKRITSHRIEIETDAQRPTMMPIAQSFYRAWEAHIDNEPATIWRANYAFQALELPPGRHRVHLAYNDRRFKLGAVISGVALLLCVGALVPRRTVRR